MDMDEILGIINHLSIYLQKSNLDIIKCIKLVKSTILQLTNIRFEKNTDFLMAIDACDPNSTNFIGVTKLQYLGELYVKTLPH